MFLAPLLETMKVPNQFGSPIQEHEIMTTREMSFCAGVLFLYSSRINVLGAAARLRPGHPRPT